MDASSGTRVNMASLGQPGSRKENLIAKGSTEKSHFQGELKGLPWGSLKHISSRRCHPKVDTMLSNRLGCQAGPGPTGQAAPAL